MHAMELRVLHIGNFAGKDGAVWASPFHGRTYNRLAGTVSLVLFGKCIDENEEGFDFLSGIRLNPAIRFDIARGNTPNTSFLKFAVRNMHDLVRVLRFCRARSHYFVFLPSPAGALAALLLSFSRRPLSVGLYVGGHFGAEQKYDGRKGFCKNAVKRAGAKIIDALVSRSVRKADYVITSSYKLFHEAGGADRVVMTPPAINVTAGDLESSAGIAAGARRDLVYCGELRHAKGVLDLLDAFDLLLKEKPAAEYRLVYIGSGYAEKELRQIAAKKGIQDRVVFAGQIHDVERLRSMMKNGWAFVLPSYSEGFPRSAYESFALGVPAILTPVGGIPYLVEDGKHALLATPGDPGAIKAGILALADDSSLRERLIANARELMRNTIFPRIEKHGTLDKLILQMIRECAADG